MIVMHDICVYFSHLISISRYIGVKHFVVLQISSYRYPVPAKDIMSQTYRRTVYRLQGTYDPQ